MAEYCAEAYCKANNLSVEKLRLQRFEIIAGQMIFVPPTGVKPDGLRNDLDTQPYPTLILRLDSHGEIQIETTEHTRRYLT